MSAAGGQVETLGRRLVAVHDGLRAALQELRDSTGPRAGASLTTHCLVFCSALDQHHRGENDQLFPQVVALDPALAAAVEQLRDDHGLIGFLLRDVSAAVRALPLDPDGPELERFRQTLDGLAAVLESHFRLEERKVLAVLHGRPGPAAALPWEVGGVRQDEVHG